MPASSQPSQPFWLTGDEDCGAEGGFADLPDAGGFFGGVEAGGGNYGPGLCAAEQVFGFGLRFSGAPCAYFYEQETAAGRQQAYVFYGQVLAAHEAEQQVVHAFEADGGVFERERDGRRRPGRRLEA